MTNKSKPRVAKSKSTASKSTSRSKNQPTKSPLVKRVLILSAIFVSVLLLFYVAYQDYVVRKVFEGKRWSVPARVYASPSELYVGLALSPDQFEKTLELLHYRSGGSVNSAGTYSRHGRQFTLNTREFRFWDKQEQSRRVSLSFSSNRLEKLSDSSGSLNILRLDPVLIGSFYPTRKEDRVLVKQENVPQDLINGLLAVEDRAFYQHHGISVRGIARAMWQNMRAGGFVQGGSTITQQLIKNLFLTPERSLIRKVNEAVMALIIDARYSKDEILEAYINEIFLGQDGSRAIHGFGLASEFYFDRPLSELQLHHIALLVGLVRGPSYYDPWRSPARAIARRNQVLEAMASQNFISQADFLKNKSKDLDVRRNRHRATSRFPYFEALVRRQLLEEYREEDLTSEGLRIFTTLDVIAQLDLEQQSSQILNRLEKSSRVQDLEMAGVITRRDGGEVVAMLGGRDNRGAGFNRALDAKRQIGSLIKPIVYETALEHSDRYTINTPLEDTAIRLEGPNGDIWTPKNYDRTEHGEVPLYDALTHSYNLATVRLGMDIGVGRVAKTLHDMGLTRPVDLYPSLLLGAVAMTPLEVTQVYQTMAGDGFFTPLRAIHAVVDSNDQVLQRYPLSVRQVLDPAATYLTNRILQRVMREGTGKSVYQTMPKEFEVAGKTGTTNSLRDSWFAGFTGDYLGVVWIGRDDNQSTGLTGSSGALQVWTQTMHQLSRQPVDLFPPESIEMVWIDQKNGLLANQDCEFAIEYPYIRGSSPVEQSPCVKQPVNTIRSWFRKLF